MMIVLGSDHGGLELKAAVRQVLEERGLQTKDMGTGNDDSVDYPDFAEKVALAVSRGEAELGVLICGTGIGMSIAANKFPGVRAALVTDDYMAQMARQHNNANILVMGGRVMSADHARRLVQVWLDAEYEGGRHQKRLDKIARIEQEVRNGRI
jgi:ribose 5-phosphate isomerase B